MFFQDQKNRLTKMKKYFSRSKNFRKKNLFRKNIEKKYFFRLGSKKISSRYDQFWYLKTPFFRFLFTSCTYYKYFHVKNYTFGNFGNFRQFSPNCFWASALSVKKEGGGFQRQFDVSPKTPLKLKRSLSDLVYRLVIY